MKKQLTHTLAAFVLLFSVLTVSLPSAVAVQVTADDLYLGFYDEAREAEAMMEIPFTDIADCSRLYISHIKYLFDEGVMNGTGDNTFSPDASFTRAMFVTMLGRMQGIDPRSYPGTSFTDVPEGRWDTPYINWAVENGIVNGVGNNKFNPTGAIRQQEYAAIVSRYLNALGIGFQGEISGPWTGEIIDLSEADEYARDALAELASYGLISVYGVEGDGAWGVDPKDTLTRAGIAKQFGDLHYLLTHDEDLTIFATINDDVIVHTVWP